MRYYIDFVEIPGGFETQITGLVRNTVNRGAIGSSTRLE